MESGEISRLISLVFDKNDNLLCLRDEIKAKVDKSCKQYKEFWTFMSMNVLKYFEDVLTR